MPKLTRLPFERGHLTQVNAHECYSLRPGTSETKVQ